MAAAVIREIAQSDLDALARILADVWYDDEEADAALAYGTDLLAMHCSLASWGCVAEAEGEVLGCCLARRDDEPLGAYIDWKTLEDEARRLAEPLGLDLASNRELDDREHALLDEVDAERGRDGVGDLQLLILSEAARGQGLGKRLMDAGIAHLAEAGCTRYRLTTDDGCDVSIYDHLGLELLAKRVATVWEGREFCIYVYEGTV